MKKLVLVLLVLGMYSCESDNDISNQFDFEGNWLWKSSTGGIDGRTDTPESTNKTMVVRFTSNKYELFVNDELEKEMNFVVEEGSSIYTLDQVYLIHYEDGSKQSFEIKDNELILKDECHDCFQSIYIEN